METKKKSIRTIKKIRRSFVNKKVKDYNNEALFVQKANASQAFLEKNGFPQELLPKK